MKELASRGNVEIEAVFEYVIMGINDNVNNKLISSGTKSVSEFKDKLKNYEKIRGKDKKIQAPIKDKRRTFETSDKPDKYKTSELCRFNCGNKRHRSEDCKNKKIGVKCFKCNEYGHMAQNCKKENFSNISNANVALVESSVNYG